MTEPGRPPSPAGMGGIAPGQVAARTALAAERQASALERIADALESLTAYFESLDTPKRWG